MLLLRKVCSLQTISTDRVTTGLVFESFNYIFITDLSFPGGRTFLKVFIFSVVVNFYKFVCEMENFVIFLSSPMAQKEATVLGFS